MRGRYDVSETVEIPKKKRGSGFRRFLTAFFVTILVLIVGLTAAVFIYMHSLGINRIDLSDRSNDNTNDDALFDGLSDDEKEKYYDMITAARGDSDRKTELYNWYKNGENDLMNKKDVLNILIVGVDASGNEPMHGNSDVMMLCSVDKKKGAITLCSFLRDSYTYYEVSEGNGVYSKLNAAYANGGAGCLMSAIEKNYKIDLNYFVAVDFEAFEKVIDAIGGINLNVTEKEAKAMEEYANITGVPYGENVLLNGEHALLFARMRKIYASGDVQRTENQRKVINAIIKKSKSLGLKDLNKVVQTLCQYVYTDCSTARILTLGANAILGRWYDFKVYSMEAPPETAREPYDGNSWMWIVDYPYSAQYVQKQIYGESNIVIQ